MKRMHIALGLVPTALLMAGGCAFPNANFNRYPPKSYSNPELKAKYEEEFKTRSLDPIEGFWHSENEFGEGTGVIYRTDPSTNSGFAFAGRSIEGRTKTWQPNRVEFDAVGARYKPTDNPSVYKAEVLLSRGDALFWNDATLTLLTPTTAEMTVHVQAEVMGGKTQRGYLVGPKHVLDERMKKSVIPNSEPQAGAKQAADCDFAKLPHKQEQDRESLALIDFDAEPSLGARTGSALADLARDAMLASQQFILVDRENMLTILGEEDLAAAIKCDQARCLVQFGKKLRAQKICHGRVSKIGSTFVLKLGVTDCSTAETVAMRTCTVTGSVDGLVGTVRPLVCDLLRELAKKN